MPTIKPRHRTPLLHTRGTMPFQSHKVCILHPSFQMASHLPRCVRPSVILIHEEVQNIRVVAPTDLSSYLASVRLLKRVRAIARDLTGHADTISSLPTIESSRADNCSLSDSIAAAISNVSALVEALSASIASWTGRPSAEFRQSFEQVHSPATLIHNHRSLPTSTVLTDCAAELDASQRNAGG